MTRMRWRKVLVTGGASGMDGGSVFH